MCGVEEEHQSEPPWAGPKVFLFPPASAPGCLTMSDTRGVSWQVSQMITFLLPDLLAQMLCAPSPSQSQHRGITELCPFTSRSELLRQPSAIEGNLV